MKKNFKIEGMSCTACAAAIERTVNKMDGVEDAVVNYATENLSVTYDDSSVHAPRLGFCFDKRKQLIKNIVRKAAALFRTGVNQCYFHFRASSTFLTSSGFFTIITR